MLEEYNITLIDALSNRILSTLIEFDGIWSSCGVSGFELCKNGQGFIPLGLIPRPLGRLFVLCFFHFCVRLVYEPYKSGRNTAWLAARIACSEAKILFFLGFIPPRVGFEAEECSHILPESRTLPLSWASGEPLIAQRAKFPPGALLWSRISGGPLMQLERGRSHMVSGGVIGLAFR